MPVEIRILTGARTGQVLKFDQAVVVVGRHANTDLRFDPQSDLDVSGRHAEIRVNEGQYVIHDASSTNGTFVNGKKLAPSRVLESGDKIQFGAKGPEVEIVFSRVSTGAPIKSTPRSNANTEQRVAMAVREQTKGLKQLVIAAVVLAVAGGGGAFLYVRQNARTQIDDLKKTLSSSDSIRQILQVGQSQGDTAFANEVQRKIGELQQRLPNAKTDAERATIKAEIDKNQAQLIQLVRMDPYAIRNRNAPAVVILISQIEGENAAGTGFGVTPDGLIITNRHNVRNADGKLPTKIAIKYTDTGEWLPAHVVKVSDDDAADLALIQVDRAGPFPAVAGLSAGQSDAAEGLQVLTIGYPSGYDTPMEGTGNDFIAKSTLSPGTVSKRTSSVLQIDSYATHGSSGSPVFSARGLVIGVVYGGASEAGGKIVYAVTPEKLAAFLPPELKKLIQN
jgi:S1-C subfamily serine protease